MTDPDQTPPGPSTRLDPAQMVTEKHHCALMDSVEGLELGGFWREGVGPQHVRISVYGRARVTIDITQDEARQLAADLVEMADAVDAVLARQGASS